MTSPNTQRIPLHASVGVFSYKALTSSRNPHKHKRRPQGAGVCSGEQCDYFTASFSAFAARNFGTRIAGTSIDSPVRGLRAVRALRILAEKIPRPAIDTSVPSLSASTIEPITVSTARSASAFETSRFSCTLLMMSALFIMCLKLYKWRVIFVTLCDTASYMA